MTTIDAMVSLGRHAALPDRGGRRSRFWLVVGVATSSTIAIADSISHHAALLTGVVLGPLLAAIGASAVEVGILGVYSLGLVVILGEVNGIFFTANHFFRMTIVVAASVAATALTLIRQRWQSEVAQTMPQALDGERLRVALSAGRMGTWRWDLRTGDVVWDAENEALFGLPPGGFDASMHMYRSMIHPDDRQRAIDTVNDAMARNRPWRFDHRVVWPDGSVHWLEGRGQPVQDATGAIVGAAGVSVDIDERRRLLEAEQETRTRLRTLLESSERLGALDDPDRILETICDVAAHRIGAWASVVRVAPDGSLERSNVTHRDPALTAILEEVVEALGDSGRSVAHVLETGEPLMFDGLTEEALATIAGDPSLRSRFEKVAFDSAVAVPLTIAGRRLAVLTIGTVGHRLTPADVELAVDLGRRGASALERARLWQASNQRFEAEHRIVELLQKSIVPDRLPLIPGVEIAAAYRPAEVDVDVGGDWYDAFTTPDGAIMVVVGDVAGHGVEAASLMGRVRNALRAYAFESSDPAEVLLRVHRLLSNQDEAAMVTAFVARYEPGSGVVSWSRAGHPPPLFVDDRGATRFLDDVNGAPLGTMAREYRTANMTIEPGSLLVFYTDGLVERRDRVLDDGLAWLAERVHEHKGSPPETLCDKLVDDPFVPHPSPDDICVVVLRTTAPDA